MIVDHGAPLFNETPTARRILAIDDEIAALDRVRPKARYLWYGTALLIGVLIWAVTLVAVGSGAADVLFRTILVVAIPSVIFAIQLTRNSHRRHELERELDTLIAEPQRSHRLLRPTEERRRRLGEEDITAR
jgi:hypothetical protein